MKKPSLFTTLIIFSVIVLALVSYFALLRDTVPKSGVHKTPPEVNEGGKEVTALQGVNGVTCYQNSQYYIVVRERGQEPGNDFLVQQKGSKREGVSCAWSPTEGDFEITNEPTAYFLTLLDHYLILDSGTAPEPREFIVYDLKTQESIFHDTYARPVERGHDTITYWTPVSTKPTTGNCPKLHAYQENGLGAVIESRAELPLDTLKKKDLGESRCEPVQ